MKRILSTVKKIWQKPIARIITSLLIIGLLLTQLPLTELWITLSRISPVLWAIAVIIFMAGHTVGVSKWTLLINIGREKFPFWITFRYYFAGLFANLFLPSIAGGDVVRAGMAIHYNPREKEAVILGSVLDRFLDMIALALFVLLGALFSSVSLESGVYQVVVWTFLIFAGLIVGLMLFLVIPLPAKLPAPIQKIIERVRGIIRQLLRNPQRALLGLILALTIQGTFILLNAFIGARVGINLPLTVWFFAWPLAKLSATLPISMGGLGVREAALAVFLGQFGVPMAAAVGLGLVWQTILVAGGLLGGIFYFILSRKLPSAKEFGMANPQHQGEV